MGEQSEGMSSNISDVSNRVGKEFVQVYFNLLHDSPSNLSSVYKGESTRTFRDGPKEETLKGVHEIKKNLEQFKKNCLVKIHSVTIQPSCSNSVLVSVIGKIRNPGEQARIFSQTVLLHPQQPTGFFCLNDIFQYIDQDEISDDFSEEQAQQDVLSATEPKIVPVLEEPTPEPVPVEEPVVEPTDTKSETKVEPSVSSPTKSDRVEPEPEPVSEPPAVPSEPTPEPTAEPKQQTEEAPSKKPESRGKISYAAIAKSNTGNSKPSTPPVSSPAVVPASSPSTPPQNTQPSTPQEETDNTAARNPFAGCTMIEVKNFTSSTVKDHLVSAFSEFGEVKSVRFSSSSAATITFSTPAAAVKLGAKLNQSSEFLINQKAVSIEPARKKSPYVRKEGQIKKQNSTRGGKSRNQSREKRVY